MAETEYLLPTRARPIRISRSSEGAECSMPRENGKPRILPLVDCKGELNIELKGFPKLRLYAGDLFHTLVNSPNPRFYAFLILAYAVLFCAFASVYYMEASSRNCIPGVHSFSHAVWFSVQTAMTIGYGGELTPDPNCFFTNFVVAAQSVVSLLAAYSLLGVVYARFARPAKRASTLVFSQNMVLHEENGIPRLAFRVANMRKHQIIEVNIRMLVALDNVLSAEHESMFRFTALPLEGGSQKFMGLPCTISHPITHNSPLHGISYEMMERCDMEILVLLEGTDASTSMRLQARHSYTPCDIQYNHRFETMVTRSSIGRRCVDFTKFHTTVPVPQLDDFPMGGSSLNVRRCSEDGDSDVQHTLPPILQTPTALSSPRGQLLQLPPLNSTSADASRVRLLPRKMSLPENRVDLKAQAEQGARGRGRAGFGWKSEIERGDSARVGSVGAAIQEYEFECDERAAESSRRAHHWRQIVIELCARIQSCNALDATDPETFGLLEMAKTSMRDALQMDSD